MTAMREIKFRGKSAGEWHYGHFFAYRKTGGGTGGHFIIQQEKEDKNLKPIQVIPDTVGQYTGVRDKYGTPIYEGDIVRFHMRDRFIEEPEWQEGTIVFDDGMFFAKLPKSTLYLCAINYGDYEVIGNKYDNPELLKGGEV